VSHSGLRSMTRGNTARVNRGQNGGQPRAERRQPRAEREATEGRTEEPRDERVETEGRTGGNRGQNGWTSRRTSGLCAFQRCGLSICAQARPARLSETKHHGELPNAASKDGRRPSAADDPKSHHFMRPKMSAVQRFHTSAAASYQVSRSAAVGHRMRPLALLGRGRGRQRAPRGAGPLRAPMRVVPCGPGPGGNWRQLHLNAEALQRSG
jgi:hypothetical protein